MDSINRPTDPERWVDQCGDYLFRYVLLRLGDPDLAEDVVREAFLAAHSSVFDIAVNDPMRRR